MELHKGGKEYLKTILVLEQQNGVVRSLDVAKALHVTKPSVSKAMKRLREGVCLTMDGDKRIRLTTAGREAALQALDRHHVLKACLTAMRRSYFFGSPGRARTYNPKRGQNIVEKHSQGAFLLVLPVLRLAAPATGSARLRTR